MNLGTRENLSTKWFVKSNMAPAELPVSESKETSVTETTSEDAKIKTAEEHGAMKQKEPGVEATASSKAVVTPSETSPGKDTEDNIEYPHGLKLVLILAALCLSVFLVALDQTIIATAIPKITDHFKSIGDIGWYGSSYLLTATALQPTFGRVYTIFSVSHLDLGSCCGRGTLDLEQLIQDR